MFYTHVCVERVQRLKEEREVTRRKRSERKNRRIEDEISAQGEV